MENPIPKLYFSLESNFLIVSLETLTTFSSKSFAVSFKTGVPFSLAKSTNSCVLIFKLLHLSLAISKTFSLSKSTNYIFISITYLSNSSFNSCTSISLI